MSLSARLLHTSATAAVAGGLMLGLAPGAFADDSAPAPTGPSATGTALAAPVSNPFGLELGGAPEAVPTFAIGDRSQVASFTLFVAGVDPARMRQYSSMKNFRLTSSGKSTVNCDVATVQQKVDGQLRAEDLRTPCELNLAPLAPGESSRVETLTFSGEADGTPFTVQRSFRVVSLSGTFVVIHNGRELTNHDLAIADGSDPQFTVRFTNTSQVDVIFDHPALCYISSIKPGATAECSGGLGPAAWRDLRQGDTVRLDRGFMGKVGNEPTHEVRSGNLTIHVAETPGQAPTQPNTTPDPLDVESNTPTPPLAETGLPVVDTIAAAVAMVGAGAVLLIGRRRGNR